MEYTPGIYGIYGIYSWNIYASGVVRKVGYRAPPVPFSVLWDDGGPPCSVLSLINGKDYSPKKK